MIAIFDLDGTLTQRDTLLPFLFRVLRTRPLKIPRASVLPFLTSFYLLGLLDNHQLKEFFLRSIIGGERTTLILDLAQSYVSYVLDRGLHPVGKKLLELHQRRGDRVIIATASISAYAKDIGRALGIEEIISTELEVLNGVFTGRIKGQNCHSLEKLRRVKQYLNREEGIGIAAYSDHRSDYHLLRWAQYGWVVGRKGVKRFKKEEIW